MKYIKIKELPLAIIDKSKMDIIENKKYIINYEDRNFLFKELKKIENKQQHKFITTIEDINGNHIASKIMPKSNKAKVLNFKEPNPIQLYFNLASENFDEANKFQKKLLQDNDVIEESSLFNIFFKRITTGIVFLVMSIEGQLNQIIPDDIEINNKNKNEIEFENFEDKIKIYVSNSKILGLDFSKNNNFDYMNITQMINLRNDLIHLKTQTETNQTKYSELFKRIIDFKIETNIKSTFTLLHFLNKTIEIE
jgi:hypothetical protein